MSLIVWSIIVLVLLALVFAGAVRKQPRRRELPSSEPGLSGRGIPDAGNSGRDSDKTSRRSGSKRRDDYSGWVNVLRDEKPNTHEFDLLGTRATLDLIFGLVEDIDFRDPNGGSIHGDQRRSTRYPHCE